MSWNSTVRCSWCYTNGHNRRGCPERKEYIKGNPDSYEARRQMNNNQISKARRCSYCKGRGHNAQTCQVKEEDRGLLVQKLKRQRKKIKDYMMASGFGVGALIKIENRYWNIQNSLYLVTAVDWINSDSTEGVEFIVIDLQSSRERNLRDCVESLNNAPPTVVSPSTDDPSSLCFPVEWEEGRAYVESTYFSKGESRPWWARDEKE